MTRLRDTARPQRPPGSLQMADGTLEALKWLALGLMVADHVNKWLYAASLPGVFEAARVVAPLFAFILACNLARPGALDSGMFLRVERRLALFGLLATPPFMALVGGWWPLNILFTLLAGTLVLHGLLLRTAWSTAGSVLLFAVSGLVVEFLYPALLMFLAAWWLCRRPSAMSWSLWILAVASLQFINHNAWALAAVPLVMAASQLDLRVRRWPHVFYWAYPLHLSVIWWVVQGPGP